MIVLLWLLVASQARYHDIAIKDLARLVYPRACVIGTVGRVRLERDGDIHFRLSEAGAFVVVEIIPQYPLPRPKEGQRIRACGIVRYDRAHRWHELHPVTSIALAGRP